MKSPCLSQEMQTKKKEKKERKETIIGSSINIYYKVEFEAMLKTKDMVVIQKTWTLVTST